MTARGLFVACTSPHRHAHSRVLDLLKPYLGMTEACDGEQTVQVKLAYRVLTSFPPE